MYLLFLGLALSTLCLAEEQCPAILQEGKGATHLGEMRVKAIKGWDKLLTWTCSARNRSYHLQEPLNQTIYKTQGENLANFVKNYGYFSIHHPIVGMVTDSERDIEVVQCLLQSLQTETSTPEELQFATDEVLAKVMAYRNLKKGMKIKIPLSKEEMKTYIVDEVINLWRGMPAFGLIPENGGVPILLYRGTDLDLVSEKGWASILSDLDTTGTGHRTFMRAEQEIHSWLAKVQQIIAPARIVGFSLGGVFVIYTLIYENELINKQLPSTAFNPPGISPEILEKWQRIPNKQRPPQITYVNQCDMVSQIGLFLDNTQEITLDHPMEVIEAHVTLICAEPLYRMSRVDAAKENQSRSKRQLSY